jgi:hypothetical protein
MAEDDLAMAEQLAKLNNADDSVLTTYKGRTLLRALQHRLPDRRSGRDAREVLLLPRLMADAFTGELGYDEGMM